VPAHLFLLERVVIRFIIPFFNGKGERYIDFTCRIGNCNMPLSVNTVEVNE